MFPPKVIFEVGRLYLDTSCCEILEKRDVQPIWSVSGSPRH